MTPAVLLFRAGLTERFPEFLIEKQRIVTEPP
jgi:hypothetical protein